MVKGIKSIHLKVTDNIYKFLARKKEIHGKKTQTQFTWEEYILYLATNVK